MTAATFMFEIEIANQQTSLDVDEDHLRRVVHETLLSEQIAGARVSVALVDNATIRELNARHLNHDYDTDVLSFLLESEPADASPPGGAAPGSRGKRIEGEVVVSVEKAAESAGRFGWRPLDETVLYLVHGVLHLVGYDDATPSQLEIMRARERAILNRWNLVPVYDDPEAPRPGAGGGRGDASGADA